MNLAIVDDSRWVRPLPASHLGCVVAPAQLLTARENFAERIAQS